MCIYVYAYAIKNDDDHDFIVRYLKFVPFNYSSNVHIFFKFQPPKQ